MALKLVWRSVDSDQRRSRGIQNGDICVEVDQRITSSKSDIIDVYREESRPENRTLWHSIETARGPDNRPSDLTR
jgi:hypothetical protein